MVSNLRTGAGAFKHTVSRKNGALIYQYREKSASVRDIVDISLHRW